MTVVINMDYGPWDGSMFHQKAAEAALHLKTNGGAQHPFFREWLPGMLKDLGWSHRRHDPDVVDEVVDRFLSCWDEKSRRVSLNRWMEFCRSSRLFNETWHMRLATYSHIAVLEAQGASASKPLHKLSFLGSEKPSETAAGSAEGAPKESKGTKAAGERVARAVRSKCQSTMALATRFLLDPAARRMSSMLVTVSHPSDLWHRAQVTSNRSPNECLDYYLQQAAGQGLEHLTETLNTLREPQKLESCGFNLDPLSPCWTSPDAAALEREEQDGLAKVYVTLVLCVMRLRLSTVLQSMLACPLSLVLLLHPDETMRWRHMKWLRICFDGYHKVKSTVAPSSELEKMIGRSWFEWQLVRDVLALLWVGRFEDVVPLLQELLDQCFRGLGQTKAVEDGMKVMRTAENVSANKKVGCRAKWCCLQESNVLKGLHRMPVIDPVKSTLPASLETAKQKVLPTSLHHPRMKDATTPRIHGYIGTNDRDWPSYTGVSVQKLLGEQLLFNKCRSGWECLKGRHASFLQQGLVVRRVGRTDDWLWSLGKHWGHAALTVPIKRFVYRGQEFFFPAAPKPHMAYSNLLQPVFDIRQWEAFELQWVSPSHLGCRGSDAPKGVVGLPVAAPVGVLQLAATRAFWAVPEAFLDDLAKDLGILAKGTLFEKLSTLVQAVLGAMSEQDLLELLAQRAFIHSTPWEDEWLESKQLMDELDKEDLAMVKDRWG